MKQIITALTILTVALLTQAREMTSWSGQELYDQADLVLIAKPISTQHASEKAVLPNISQMSMSSDCPQSSPSVW